MKSSSKQYLNRFAEKQAQTIAQTIANRPTGKPYQYVLTIPAYREDAAFFLRLKHTLLAQHNVLLIIVINQPDRNDNAAADTQRNQQLWDTIENNTDSQEQYLDFSILQCGASSIILLDRFNKGLEIPIKQGVGLARKIACDIACHLIEEKMIHNQWIHTTDADTTLPDHYFSALEEQVQYQHSAAIYSFTHKGSNSTIDNATQLYEQALNYYVTGLQWAGSSYAFHTIGSCIAINAKHYMQARGYPKRAGGEDFYLLNKLAKLGKVINIEGCELTIDARLSERVPFGTGPTVEKIINNNGCKYYNPMIFIELKHIVAAGNTLFENKNETRQWMQQLTAAQQKALMAIGIEHFFKHLAQQIKTQSQCEQHWQDWLDAFKTLKLIHALEEYYPKVPLEQAIDTFCALQAREDMQDSNQHRHPHH